jgi:phage repressor protein C with HTH and peptisase S24 domain
MTHHGIWIAIESFARSVGMSCSGLARHSGLDATTFNKSKRWSSDGKPRWPSTQSIAKILEVTGKNIEDFIKFLPREERAADSEKVKGDAGI